jgi:hypothetical protein
MPGSYPIRTDGGSAREDVCRLLQRRRRVRVSPVQGAHAYSAPHARARSGVEAIPVRVRGDQLDVAMRSARHHGDHLHCMLHTKIRTRGRT